MLETTDIDGTLNALPMVQAGKGIAQNPWHRHDVYQHTVAVVELLKADPLATRELVAAGWLHDVGKPVTKVPKRDASGTLLQDAHGRPYHSFPRHEAVGETMVRELDRAIFEQLQVCPDRVAQLVGWHFLPMTRIKQAKQDPTLATFRQQTRQLAIDLTETGMRDEILILFAADKGSQQASDLPFLAALRTYLLDADGDLETLFDLFLQAYGRGSANAD
jgi:hypothetical protein